MDPISDHPDVVIFPPVIAASALVVILLLHWLWPLDIFLRPMTFALGATLCALGIGCAAWGRITLVRAGTNVSPLKPTTAIVTGGSFRFTRNPLYVGGTALLFGVSLLIGTWWASGARGEREELAIRSSIGFYLFVPPGENERLIARSGFRLLSSEDVTEDAAAIAQRWYDAREKHRVALR